MERLIPLTNVGDAANGRLGCIGDASSDVATGSGDSPSDTFGEFVNEAA